MNATSGINLIPDNDTLRLNALKRYEITNTPQETDFDNIATLAKEIFKTPIVLISLVDEKQVFFKAKLGIDNYISYMEREESLCSLAIQTEGITVFEDTSKHGTIENLLTGVQQDWRFYAAAPLITSDGFIIGNLSIADKEPHTFNEEKETILIRLAKVTMNHIEIRSMALLESKEKEAIYDKLVENDQMLASAYEELTASNEELQEGNEVLKAMNKELSQAQEELQLLNRTLTEKEAGFRNMIFQAPVAMALIKGPELIFDTINDSMLKIIGKSQDIIGKPYAVALPELEGQPYLKLLKEVYNTGITYYGDEAKAYLEHNGELVAGYFNFIYQPIKDANGNTTAIIAVANEVTEQVTAWEHEQDLNEELNSLNEELAATNEELIAGNEELASANKELNESQRHLRLLNNSLAESESRFRTIVQQAPVAICNLIGRELILDQANKKILEFWGKSDDIIGKPLAVALPELEGQPFLKLLDNVYTSGEVYYGNEEKASLEHEGTLIEGYFNFIYQPIKDENGAVNSIMMVATEVTDLVLARKEKETAEEKFRLLADNISQLAWMADETGWIFWYNQRWYDYTNTTFEEMQGWGWQKVHHPDYVQKVTEKFNEHLKNGEAWEDIFPLKRHDGEYRWFLSRAIPVKDEQGNVIRWFGSNTDITEQRRLEQLKDEFMAVASHELKTPVTSLNACLQLLERMKDNPSPVILPRLIEQSTRSMEKIKALIDDLLHVNRISEGQLQFNKTRFNIYQMLAGCCNHVRMAGKHELIVQGDKNLQVYADEPRIDQVVVNFVNNAVKYAPDSKEIYLKIEQEGKMVRISVTDNGPGISPDKIPHLFGRYFRADYTGVQYSGLGLGLYICSEIVKKHGGQIGVQSEPGKGSTFWFTLPL